MSRTTNNRQTTFNRRPLTWIKDAWFLAKPYWTSEEKYRAVIFISFIIIFNLFTVYMTILLNKWNNVFYDALQNHDQKTFISSIYKFCMLAFFYILFQILAYYFRKLLEIRWRRWLTKFYLNRWFDKKSYYKTRFLNQISDNPDQRISDDINGFIVLFLDLTLGLMNSVVTLFSFVVILWKISGSLNFTLDGHHFSISGYMVYTALIYAIAGTYITFKIGKPLIKLNFQQQAYEADFRYGLIRIREYGENIAFYNGEAQEKVSLINRFTNVVNNFVATIYRNMKIEIFGTAYGQLAIIFPIVVAAPRYFAKVIQLGDLMQILSAFGRVQGAMSYFIDAYTSLSGWRAVMDRLYGFQQSMNEAGDLSGLPIKSADSYLKLENLVISLPNQQILAKGINFDLSQGDRLLIRGRSGSGKTTLLRAIAGLWHFAQGTIYQKNDLTSLFIAQKPYLPLGTLKETLCYPKINCLPDDQCLAQLLEKCNLNHLVYELNNIADWGNKLSLGEQQRIAFCRILVNNPDIIYLDEATSALDEETESKMYQLLIKQLPQSVVISIGHRSTIKQWHNKELDFNQLSSQS